VGYGILAWIALAFGLPLAALRGYAVNNVLMRFAEDIRKQQEAWSQLVQPFAENIRQMNQRMEPYRRMAERIQKQMQDAARAAEPIRQHIARMQAALEPMRDFMRRFIEQQQAHKENYRKAQDYLFAEGWYLGGDMPLPNYRVLATMVDAAEHMELEQTMCDWARSQADSIIESAAQAFPHRADILKDAADAHHDGKYSLSIPVFFAQSDGMANEIIGNCLFRGNPPAALEQTLAQFEGFPLSDLSDILLDPLRDRSSFYTCSTKQATKSGVKMANRSEVIHGAQLDYRSEANSLRGIVLLGYLVGVKSLLESHAEHVTKLQGMLNEALASGATATVAEAE
jgi:uncharacterized protein YukE